MSARKDQLPMESEMARQRIELYLYDEVGVQEREEIERACEDDPAFRALFEDEQSLLVGLDQREPEVASEALLAECRHNLMRAVYLEELEQERLIPPSAPAPWWRNLAASFSVWNRAWQPVMAASLLGIGYFIGQIAAPSTAGNQQAVAEILSVRADDESGNVQIVLNERKTLTGSADDPQIRQLLLSTARESHPGARLASLEALRTRGEQEEVRQQFLHSMLEDENLGVRLKALDLVRVGGDRPDVQQALVKAVMRDPNSGMRVQAVQVLTAHANRAMVGDFQMIIEQQQLPFVRQKVESALMDLGASVEHH